MTWNGQQKNALSIRDGFLEYSGQELNIEPAARIFRVYRSPATIALAAPKMVGIPLTDEHVSIDEPVRRPVGAVLSAEVVDNHDNDVDSRLAVQNSIEIGAEGGSTLDSGKRELSLGYSGDLVPCELDGYDYEQRNIQPHHLAVVQNGRCGSACSFMDKKTTNDSSIINLTDKDKDMKKFHLSFSDDGEAVNLEKIIEVVTALPEAIKTVPLETVQKVMPALQEMLALAKTAGAIPEEVELTDEELKAADAEKAAAETAAAEKTEQDKEAGRAEFKDSSGFKDAVAASAKKFVDEAVATAVKQHATVIEKAKGFVDDTYSFADKTTNQIMIDALATESAEKFADSDLPLAFKLLKSSGQYKNFADEDKEKKLKLLADKEL